MKFGDNLRTLRKQRKISQEELAEKVNVSRQSVSKWETGDAYPEMNNILELCKIFHCQINDLVHANMSDIDSLDEEIKMKVVKLEEEKQRKMKGLSKAISVIARIFKAVTSISIVVMAICLIIVPIILSKVKITDTEFVVFGETMNYQIIDNKIEITYDGHTEELKPEEDNIVVKKLVEKIKDNKVVTIVFFEIVFALVIVILILLNRVCVNLDKLFTNIYNGETPFTLENCNYIKKMAVLLTALIIVPAIVDGICELILSSSIGISINFADVIEVLFLLSLTYIFEYGYEIQKDSKGVMYNEK